jgi:hypothetical protein
MPSVPGGITPFVKGLSFFGTVTSGGSLNSFTVASLAGMSAGMFRDWTAMVQSKANGLQTAPFEERVLVLSYDYLTGNFITTPFTANVVTGDELCFIHPLVANSVFSNSINYQVISSVTSGNGAANGSTMVFDLTSYGTAASFVDLMIQILDGPNAGKTTKISTVTLGAGGTIVFDVPLAYQVTTGTSFRILLYRQLEDFSLDGVYVDYENGVSGITDFPAGTPMLPVRSISTAISIASFRKLRKIYLVATYTTVATIPAGLSISNMQFIGVGRYSRIDIDGGTVGSCEFVNCRVTYTSGTFFDSILRDCRVQFIANTATCLGIRLVNTEVRGSVTTSPLSGGAGDKDNPNAIENVVFATDLVEPVITLRNVVAGGVELTQMKGRFHIGNLNVAHGNGAPSVVYVYLADGAVCTVDVTCTLGTINVYGNGTVVNNSGGTTINDHTLSGYNFAGKTRILEVAVTSAANAGDVTLATILSQPCLIKSITITSNGATTANLTSCAIYAGTGKVVTLIDALTAIRANLDATDKQISDGSGDGAWRLGVGKTIVMTLVGTGATAVNLTVSIEYEPCANGGSLA